MENDHGGRVPPPPPALAPRVPPPPPSLAAARSARAAAVVPERATTLEPAPSDDRDRRSRRSWGIVGLVVTLVVILAIAAIAAIAAMSGGRSRTAADEASQRVGVQRLVTTSSVPIAFDDQGAQCLSDRLASRLGKAKLRVLIARSAQGRQVAMAPADAAVISSTMVACAPHHGVVGYFQKTLDTGLGSRITGTERVCVNRLITPALSQRALAAFLEGHDDTAYALLRKAIYAAGSTCLKRA